MFLGRGLNCRGVGSSKQFGSGRVTIVTSHIRCVIAAYQRGMSISRKIVVANPIVDLDGDEMTRVSGGSGLVYWDGVKKKSNYWSYICICGKDHRKEWILNYYPSSGHLGFHQGKAYTTVPRPEN